MASDAPQTRAEWVDHRLREAIIRGEFRPGEKLVPAVLAQRWNVSPTPLREAYQRLAVEGLVELTAQRGARVADMSYEDALDVYSTRQILEPHALEMSLLHRDREWSRDVQRRFSALREELSYEPIDAVAFEDAHTAFHDTLLSRAGSEWLHRLIRMLQGHSTRYRLQSLGPRGGAGEVLQEHEALMGMCLAGDVDGAAQALSAHLDLTLSSLLGWLSDTSAESPVSSAESTFFEPKQQPTRHGREQGKDP